MKSSSSDRKTYFCTEPWTGGFSVQTNLDVKFCPCYLNMKIGSLRESSIEEIWNSRELQQIRRSFSEGELAEACEGQLCPVALGHGTEPPAPVGVLGSGSLQPDRRWPGNSALRQVLARLGGLFRSK